MKGFIELTKNRGGKISFSINNLAFEDKVVIFNGIWYEVRETYEEIKELIKNAQ